MLTAFSVRASRAGHRNGGISMMPLSYAEIGQPQIIRKISGSPEIKRHLEDLGFNVGSEVSIVSTLAGNLIVKVRESRVAVNGDLARRILV